jgi:hypothetical protein
MATIETLNAWSYMRALLTGNGDPTGADLDILAAIQLVTKWYTDKPDTYKFLLRLAVAVGEAAEGYDKSNIDSYELIERLTGGNFGSASWRMSKKVTVMALTHRIFLDTNATKDDVKYTVGYAFLASSLYISDILEYRRGRDENLEKVAKNMLIRRCSFEEALTLCAIVIAGGVPERYTGTDIIKAAKLGVASRGNSKEYRCIRRLGNEWFKMIDAELSEDSDDDE